jgi:P22_AR N-terminal domain
MRRVHSSRSSTGSEKQTVQQQIITVMGEELSVVLTHDDHLYISLPEICAALGVNVRAQIRRIQRTQELLPGLRQLMLMTRGGPQRINCLQVDRIRAWLEGIQADTVQSTFYRKFEVYQRELATLARAAFPHTQGHTTFTTGPASGIGARTGALTEEQRPERRALIANIPSGSTDSHLIVTSFPEDTAFRESAFAPEERWTMGVGVPHFTASNQVQVYLGHPNHLLDLPEALKRIGELRESTVLTARIAVGLWTTRRLDRRLSENGSAAIGLEEVLEWRGIQKHTRLAYPGSTVRLTDGYEAKHKQQVYRDFNLLQQCHLQREYTLVEKNGTGRTILVMGPYLRVSVVMERTLWNDTEVVGFLVSPGDWFTTHPGLPFDHFALIDRRIFQLHAWQDQLTIRLGLYLVERWRQQALKGSFEEPITIIDLLAASMIEIDERNLTSRFAWRIEAALNKLFERGILGSRPLCLTTIDKTRDWGRAWLHSLWRLVPQQEVRNYYQHPEQLQLTVGSDREQRQRGRRSKNDIQRQ